MKIAPLFLIGMGSLLLSCANLPSFPGNASTAPEQDDPQTLEAQGRYAELAALRLSEAARLQGRERLPLLAQAAWAAAREQSAPLLRESLNLYPNLALPPQEKAVYDTYDAFLLALEDQATLALQRLDASLRPDAPLALADYWLARALAYQGLDDGEAATAMLVRRAALLNDAGRIDNARRIWEIQLEPTHFVLAAGLKDYDPVTQGWLDLGRIARGFWSDETRLQAALAQWSESYPTHPAAGSYLAATTRTATETLRSAVRRIALLLPTSGRLAGVGTALRDGFLAAHFQSNTQDLEVRFYDSGDDPARRYEEAVAEGAELIIGPLDKDGVEAVVQRNGGQLPILALNYRDEGAPSNGLVLQFGLAPEDEARAVARQALADGYTRALALVADEDWAQRAWQAFRLSFAAGGGQVIDSRVFSGGPRDYPAVIQPLLKLEDSRQRTRALERLLGTELASDPVRRQDAQFLFLAANPSQGRQLRPQLRFYHASDLPVYATDRIYSGQVDPRQDKDLNGVRFCAMPWLLKTSESWETRRQQVVALWPQRAERYNRLFAMGFDAYLLATRLREGNWSRLPPIPGATGELARDGDRIVRDLPCARFDNGQPQALPPRDA